VLNLDGLSRSALYVGCSRARTLSGLYLEGSFKAPSCSDNDPIEVEMSKVESRMITLQLMADPKSTILTLAQNTIVDIDLCLVTKCNMSASFPTSVPATDGSKKQECEGSCTVELLDHSNCTPDVKWDRDPLNDVPAVRNAFIVQIGNVNIFEEDIASLNAGAWLTDAVRLEFSILLLKEVFIVSLVPQVVDGFLNLLQESQLKRNLHNFGSFFHLHLMTNRLNMQKVFERENYVGDLYLFSAYCLYPTM